MPWPEFVDNDDMQRALKVPITKAMCLVLLGTVEGGAMYKRDADGRWRKLDDHVYADDNPPPWKKT
jgi:hypothetical protein